MIIPWQSMTLGEFARFRRSLGDHIVSAGGVFWRRVRPCFYRPLLPFHEWSPGTVCGPQLSVLGGIQYPVPPQLPANSHLNMIMCDDLKSYSLASLDRHERREVKRASEVLKVSLITDSHSFKSQAYPVYRSFFERTGYTYRSDRRREDNFARWAEALFQQPKVVVLAAHDQNHELGAVGVWHLVEDTLVYATFFCDSKSLKQHATGLMLHTVREAVAGHPGISQIYVGNYKYSAAKGIDDFYLTRGCKLVRKPAWLQLNPLTEFGLKRFAPEQYQRLMGTIPAGQGGSTAEADSPSRKAVKASVSN